MASLAEVLTKKELLERYVQAAWVLKLRLISSRRHLWAETTSLIHIETSLLQMRKACEAVGYMCVLAAEIETERPLPKHRKNYKVGKIFKALGSTDHLRFPRMARRSLNKEIDGRQHWKLEVQDSSKDDHLRVARIHKRSGDLLHEKPPYIEWPQNSEVAQATLGPLLNHVRADHQWLWNRLWVHAIWFRDGLLVVELGEDTNSGQPFVIKEDTLLAEDLHVALDPEFVADFNGELKWPQDVA